MIDNNLEVIIRYLLSRDDSLDIVKFMVKEVSRLSVNNACEILSYISEVSQSIITNMNNKVTDYQNALYWSIQYYNLNFVSDNKSKIAMMLPIVKTIYPDGIANYGSASEIELFNNFKELISNKKYFSLDNSDDYGWAKSLGYVEYINKVLNTRKDKNYE